MKSLITVVLAAVALAGPGVQAKQVAWGKCGGANWHGPTTCIPRYNCRNVGGGKSPELAIGDKLGVGWY